MMPIKKVNKKTSKVEKKPKFISYTVHVANLYADLKNQYKEQLATHRKTTVKLKTQVKNSKEALATAEKKLADVKTKNKGKSGLTAKNQIARANDQVRQLEAQRAAAKQEIQALRLADDRIKVELVQLTAELKHLMDFRKQARHAHDLQSSRRPAKAEMRMMKEAEENGANQYDQENDEENNQDNNQEHEIELEMAEAEDF